LENAWRQTEGRIASLLSPRRGIALALFAVLAGAVGLATCDSESPVEPATELAGGTWGGDRAGVLVSDSVAHVHVGCTYGDFPAPIALDADSRFSVSGQYVLRAYPIAIGPPLPAQFAGVVHGNELVLTVAVNDTVEKKLVVLGPVTVVFGREAIMGPCPICEKPGDARPGSRPARDGLKSM
jgi:hypothetical protein